MNPLIGVAIGVVIGVVATGVLAVRVMRRSMVVPRQSRTSFEETCAAIERELPEAEGWSFPMESFDMSAKLAAKGGLPDNIRRIRLFFMCNPKVAKRVLADTPKLSAIMPCSWSVYELDNGSVWVSHMNISMMSKMMGGVVGDAMGQVAETDHRLLDAVLHGTPAGAPDPA